ncbi:MULTISPECIES: hypothetical protein [unclassified Methanoculleus]|jgi:hypothetical protein|uniref:hypothetical protein n=1 Tax=unclassified Methanoculleus TaxID=2619537 RepID=UPI0025D212F7|nr:hypothetical protein [Methanoculleus sp. UBA377]
MRCERLCRNGRPARGLSAVEGSQAVGTGTGVSNNGTPVDVTVMLHGVDGSDLIVMNLKL